MEDQPRVWTEEDSAAYLAFSQVITPSRGEQFELLATLVPGHAGEPFEIVEVGCGGGELAEHLLEQFTQARYLGLDGSDTMLRTAQSRLSRFGDRVRLAPFRLEAERTWLQAITQPVRCFVSSLVVHHLSDDRKQALYQRLHDALEPGGALLLIDVVLPRSPRAVRALAQNWDSLVRKQSQALTGSLDSYHQFREGEWNCYSHPDPMDLPAPLFAQLKWLEQAGFRDVDCFWQRAGHALFGGYRQK